MQHCGTPNRRHNRDIKYRAQLENVDASLSKYNEILRSKSVDEIYAEHLQPAFEEFNDNQIRKDRRYDVKWNCSTYLEYQRIMDKRARASSNAIDKKGRPPIRELVWQIGNPEQGYGCLGQTDESRTKIKEMLLECQAEAERRYPNIAWGDLDFHADEVSYDADGKVCGSLHLHSSFVPLCFQNKQGPDVQVAFERSLKEMGFNTFQEWKHDLDNIMETVLERHGLMRVVMNNNKSHQESTEFHRQQKVIKQTKQLEEKQMVIETEIADRMDGVTEILNDTLEETIDYMTQHDAAVFDNFIYFMTECDQDRFEEINTEAEALKRKKLRSSVDIDGSAAELDERIVQISKMQRELTWQERQELFKQYKELNEDFWSLRKSIGEDYNQKLKKAYNENREVWHAYQDARYLLMYSNSFLVKIYAYIKLLVLSEKKDSLEREIKALKKERQDLIKTTASFKNFSNHYREELKEGKFPLEKFLNGMETIVKVLDGELSKQALLLLETSPEKKASTAPKVDFSQMTEAERFEYYKQRIEFNKNRPNSNDKDKGRGNIPEDR